MIGLLRELRVVPIVLMASACLLALKTVGLLFEGGYIFNHEDAGKGDIEAPIVRLAPDMPQAAPSRQSWAQEMFGFPDTAGSVRPPSTPLRVAERNGKVYLLESDKHHG